MRLHSKAHCLFKIVQKSSQKALFSLKNLLSLFLTLQSLLAHRTNEYFIAHIRSHQPFPGEISTGNQVADQTLRALPVQQLTPWESHAFHHQNAKALAKQFQLPLDQARAIVQQCPQVYTSALRP